MKKLLLASAGVFALALGACSTTQQATVTTDLQTAQTNAQKIITGYDNAKTIAAALVVLYPQYAATVTSVEAKATPIVNQLDPLVTDATADASSIETLIGQLQDQVNDLTAAVKPAATAAAKRA